MSICIVRNEDGRKRWRVVATRYRITQGSVRLVLRFDLGDEKSACSKDLYHYLGSIVSNKAIAGWLRLMLRAACCKKVHLVE